MQRPTLVLALVLAAARLAAEEKVFALGTFDGVRYSGTKSVVTSTVALPGGAVEEVEHLAMYEASGPGPLRVVWTAQFDRELGSTELPRLAKLGGQLVGAVRECVTGTGGCTDRLIRRTPDGWQDVDLVGFMAAWKAKLPPIFENGFGKGIELDVKTRKATGHVYKRDDANCCPSGRSTASWDLTADEMKFLNAATETVPEN